ncbi:hypothetical protein F5Y17DRAFT_426140 [Xylariaceae sp. FL0594]|nr:hypothetical protein F5Y17DRAFT_426140 [Xylariaceae sp. FL0594]
MPARRRQARGGQDDAAPASNGNTRRRLNPANVVPRLDKLKEERNSERRQILEKHEEYINQRIENIDSHFASKTEKRSGKAKDLLVRYVEAMEKRQRIEKAIERMVLDLRGNLLDVSKILEAAYIGRLEKARSCVGSFAAMVSPPPLVVAAPDDKGEDRGAAKSSNGGNKNGDVPANKGDSRLEHGGQDKGNGGDKNTAEHKTAQPMDIFSQLSW